MYTPQIPVAPDMMSESWRVLSGSREQAVVCGFLLSTLLGAWACSDGHDADTLRVPRIATGGAAPRADSGGGGVLSASARASGAWPSATAGSAPISAAGKTPLELEQALAGFDPNRILEFEIDLDPSDWEALRGESRSLNDIIVGADCQSSPFENPFTWKGATIAIDGVSHSSARIRKKGFRGSLDHDRPSLKIAIEGSTSQGTAAVSDITLNNGVQDPAVISQCLGYSVFAKAGQPAPRCNFAHLVVNGEDLGVYSHVEPIKEPFLRRHFGSDDGDLYEGTLSDFREGWFGTFDPKTSATDKSKAALTAIVQAAAAPAHERLARLGAVVDLSAFASFWATEVLLAHADGYSRNANNFYVYRSPGTGLTTFIPWGADMLFGNGDGTAKTDSPTEQYTQGVVVNALYSLPEGRDLLLRTLSVVVDAAWNESELIAEAQRLVTMIRPRLCATQLSSLDAGLEGLQGFVMTRRGALANAVANPPANAQPLRPSACLRPIGTVSGTFATTWQTTAVADPLSIGAASIDLVIDGSRWVYVPGKLGAYASLMEYSRSDKEAQLVIAAARNDGTLSVLGFGFDLIDAVPGTLNLDMARTQGALLQRQPTIPDQQTMVGVLLGGSLVFVELGTAAGSPVRGSFSGEVYTSPLLNGF